MSDQVNSIKWADYEEDEEAEVTATKHQSYATAAGAMENYPMEIEQGEIVNEGEEEDYEDEDELQPEPQYEEQIKVQFDEQTESPLEKQNETQVEKHTEAPTEAQVEVQRDVNKTICRFFNSRHGCRKGNNCTFLHDKYGCIFFQSGSTCTFGDKCPFLHDMKAPTKAQFKKCPNPGCSNDCLGKQCSACHNYMHGKQQTRTYYRESRDTRYGRDSRDGRDSREHDYKHQDISVNEPYRSRSRHPSTYNRSRSHPYDQRPTYKCATHNCNNSTSRVYCRYCHR